MNNTDAVAGIFFGLFLVATVMHGNSGVLVKYAKRDVAFVKWAIAIALLILIRNNSGNDRSLVNLLIIGAFVALGLNAGPSIAKNASAFWQSLGGKQNG